MIRIDSDYDELDRELDRLERLPDHRTKTLLDAVLQKGFRQTQAAVHVLTGALKASGRAESEIHRTPGVWEGEITYGSRDVGPVDYAIYEVNKEADEHGDHDFMRPLGTLDPDFRAAILEVLRP